MATLSELADQGVIVRWEVPLDPGRSPQRLLYASPRLVAWLQNELPNCRPAWTTELSPAEQLDALTEIYALGETLTFRYQFKPLNPIGNGVWELKTPDLRVFGWFPHRDVFVGVSAQEKNVLLRHAGIVGGYRDEVVRFRDQLNLDAPKFVAGDLPNDVVSAFAYPD